MEGEGRNQQGVDANLSRVLGLLLNTPRARDQRQLRGEARMLETLHRLLEPERTPSQFQDQFLNRIMSRSRDECPSHDHEEVWHATASSSNATLPHREDWQSEWRSQVRGPLRSKSQGGIPSQRAGSDISDARDSRLSVLEPVLEHSYRTWNSELSMSLPSGPAGNPAPSQVSYRTWNSELSMPLMPPVPASYRTWSSELSVSPAQAAHPTLLNWWPAPFMPSYQENPLFALPSPNPTPSSTPTSVNLVLEILQETNQEIGVILERGSRFFSREGQVLYKEILQFRQKYLLYKTHIAEVGGAAVPNSVALYRTILHHLRFLLQVFFIKTAANLKVLTCYALKAKESEEFWSTLIEEKFVVVSRFERTPLKGLARSIRDVLSLFHRVEGQCRDTCRQWNRRNGRICRISQRDLVNGIRSRLKKQLQFLPQPTQENVLIVQELLQVARGLNCITRTLVEEEGRELALTARRNQVLLEREFAVADHNLLLDQQEYLDSLFFHRPRNMRLLRPPESKALAKLRRMTTIIVASLSLKQDYPRRKTSGVFVSPSTITPLLPIFQDGESPDGDPAFFFLGPRSSYKRLYEELGAVQTTNENFKQRLLAIDLYRETAQEGRSYLSRLQENHKSPEEKRRQTAMIHFLNNMKNHLECILNSKTATCYHEKVVSCMSRLSEILCDKMKEIVNELSSYAREAEDLRNRGCDVISLEGTRGKIAPEEIRFYIDKLRCDGEDRVPKDFTTSPESEEKILPRMTLARSIQKVLDNFQGVKVSHEEGLASRAAALSTARQAAWKKMCASNARGIIDQIRTKLNLAEESASKARDAITRIRSVTQSGLGDNTAQNATLSEFRQETRRGSGSASSAAPFSSGVAQANTQRYAIPPQLLHATRETCPLLSDELVRSLYPLLSDELVRSRINSEKRGTTIQKPSSRKFRNRLVEEYMTLIPEVVNIAWNKKTLELVEGWSLNVKHFDATPSGSQNDATRMPMIPIVKTRLEHLHVKMGDYLRRQTNQPRGPEARMVSALRERLECLLQPLSTLEHQDEPISQIVTWSCQLHTSMEMEEIQANLESFFFHVDRLKRVAAKRSFLVPNQEIEDVPQSQRASLASSPRLIKILHQGFESAQQTVKLYINATLLSIQVFTRVSEISTIEKRTGRLSVIHGKILDKIDEVTEKAGAAQNIIESELRTMHEHKPPLYCTNDIGNPS